MMVTIMLVHYLVQVTVSRMKHSMNDMLVIKHVSNIEKGQKNFTRKKKQTNKYASTEVTAIVICPANICQNLSALHYTETDIR